MKTATIDRVKIEDMSITEAKTNAAEWLFTILFDNVGTMLWKLARIHENADTTMDFAEWIAEEAETLVTQTENVQKTPNSYDLDKATAEPLIGTLVSRNIADIVRLFNNEASASTLTKGFKARISEVTGLKSNAVKRGHVLKALGATEAKTEESTEESEFEN